ncbi:oligosaccharide flippase family protein [Gemmatimonadota bacterium]
MIGSERTSRTDQRLSTPSLARNTAHNASITAMRLVSGLIVSPVLFWALGPESYGLWSVIWAFVGTLGLVDLRLGSAATPLIAAARESGDPKQVSRLANTGFLIYGTMCAAALVVALILIKTSALMQWLPVRFRLDVALILPAAVAAFAVTLLITLFQGFLQGFQRFDITARITVIAGVLRAILLVVVALTGGGLKEFVLVEIWIIGLQGILLAFAVRRHIPGFRFISRPDGSAFRELSYFGLKLEVAHAAHLISLHIDKLLITAFLGLEAVAYYDLGAKLVLTARSFPLLLVSATVPVASTLETAGERDRLWELYRKISTLLAWTGIPIFLWIVIGAEPLLFAWAGTTAIEARLTVWILSAGVFLGVYSGMANTVSVGLGKPEIDMRRSILAGSLNIILSASLIKLLGFPGAPLGTALAFAIGSVYLFTKVHRHFDRSPVLFLRPLALPVLTAIPATAGALLLLQQVGDSRPQNIILLVATALLVGGIFLVGALLSGILKREFLQSIRNPLAGLNLDE